MQRILAGQRGVRAVVGGLGLVVLANCGPCAKPGTSVAEQDAGGPVTLCSVDDECSPGQRCQQGACTDTAGSDAGRWDGGGSTSSSGGGTDGGADADAAVPQGILQLTPFPTVELGAQRVGTPVHVNVFAKNVGTAPLTVLQVYLDRNDSNEFGASPTGFLNNALAPEDELVVQVSYTPVDGRADQAQLKFVHTAAAEPAVVNLTAAFKGVPRISVTAEATVVEPSVTVLEMGLSPLGNTVTRTLLVRNVGAANSVLSLRGMHVAPAGVFTASATDLAGAVLSSFQGFCADATQCPEGFGTCTTNVCRDANGLPPDTLAIRVEFTPAEAGEAHATLTLSYDDGDGQADATVDLVGTGARGTLSVTPGALDFGEVFVGRTGERTLSLQNVGNAPLLVDAPAVVGDAPFSVRDAAAVLLQPGGAAVVTALLDPNTAGTFTGTLQVRGTDVEPADIPLTGSARLAPRVLADTALDFGDVYVGMTRALTLPVRNAGPGQLHVLGLSAEGPAAARFSLSPTQFPDPLAPLASLEDRTPSLDLQVSYLPLSPPSNLEDHATLVLLTDDPDQPRTEVRLTGLGIRPVMVVQPAALDFGDVAVGRMPGLRTLQVYNNGVGPLVLTEIAAPVGSPFQVLDAPPLPAEVMLGAPLQVHVQFQPQAAGLAADALTVRSLDVVNPVVSVGLSGQGTQGALAVTPGNLDFGPVFVGRLRRMDAQLRNTGDAPLVVSAAGTRGDSAFQVVNASVPITLAPGGTQNVTLEFAPIQEALAASGAAVFTHDSGPDLELPLQGSSRAEPTVLLPAALDFGSVDTRSSAVLPVALRNAGPGVLHVRSLSVSGAGAARFAISPTSFPDGLDPLAVAGDTAPNLVVNVTYQPVAPVTGLTDLAMLHVLTDDPDLPDATVTLTGVGIRPVVGVSPRDVVFGDVKVGTASAAQTLTISNTGAGPLEVQDLEITVGSPFSLLGTVRLPVTVQVGQPLSVGLVLSPVTVGPVAASLVVRTSDLTTPAVTVNLSGQGVQGLLVAEPASVSFADAFTGRSYPQVVTVTNRGTATLRVTGASVTPAGTPFSWAAATFPVTLAPLASTTLTIRYSPTSAGTHAARGTVQTDAGTDASVQLSGTARQEPTVLVPATLAFGDVYAGRAATLELPIRNRGPGVLTVTRMEVKGAAAARYSLSPTSFAGTLAALAQPADPTPKFALNVTYQPADPPGGAVDDAVVEISTDDPDLPVASVALSGRSIKPVIAVSPLAVAFGAVTVGVAASTQDVQVRNTGYGPLVLTAASLPNGTPFSVQVVGGLPAVLQPLGTPVTVRLGFTAPAPASYSTTLTLTSTDAANPNVAVGISGTGKPCDARPGANYTQNGAQCTYACMTNFYDLNGDLNAATSDGCEYACTPVAGPDLPDDGFLDTNCDGMDGDPAAAIFVDAATGQEGWPGTKAQPVATVTTGITRAQAAGKAQVYISEGTYVGRVTLVNGISLYGGYSQSHAWGRSASYTSAIRADVVVGGYMAAVEGTNLSSRTVVDRLTISTAGTSVTGVSNYAMRCVGCTGAVLTNSRLTSGTAGPGTAGNNGAVGAAGTAGFNGGTGSCDGSTPGNGGAAGSSVCGRSGGAGGVGGAEGENNGNPGGSGTGGTPSGYGGGWGDPGARGGNGFNGAAGSAGTDGAGGSGGTVTGGFWQAGLAAMGGPGNAGNGGGGGGGGGAQSCYWCNDGSGDGGGGGGGGGCGGTAGTAGTAGGGSFALLLVDSSGFTMTGNTLTSGDGGAGGTGGTGLGGGAGGGSGTGGTSCPGEVGPGGTGGAGGAGGRGGHGGGGAGGPSWAVYRVNSPVSTAGNSFAHGTGGAGGTSPGNAGAAGGAGNVF